MLAQNQWFQVIYKHGCSAFYSFVQWKPHFTLVFNNITTITMDHFSDVVFLHCNAPMSFTLSEATAAVCTSPIILAPM